MCCTARYWASQKRLEARDRKDKSKTKSAVFILKMALHQSANDNADGLNKRGGHRLQPVDKPGVVKGRLPLKLYSGSDGIHVRTDENL